MATQRKPNAVSIRTVGPFDLGRLSRLHKGCFEESWSRSDLAHLLAMPGGFGLIARLFEGGLAGLDAMRGVGFSLCRVVRDESELLSIGVAPSYRRRGVAGYLLRASMERARAIGARQMFLEVAIDNIGAQQLYLRARLRAGRHAAGLLPAPQRRPHGRLHHALRARWRRRLERAGGGVGAQGSAPLAHDQLEQIAVESLQAQDLVAVVAKRARHVVARLAVAQPNIHDLTDRQFFPAPAWSGQRSSGTPRR